MGIRAYEKGVELIADLPDDLPDQFIGDPLRLRQILINLVGNAIKFTKQRRGRGERHSRGREGRGKRGEKERKFSANARLAATGHRPKVGRGARKDQEDNHKLFLHFSVKDTGIGITAEDQQKIFAPFTQADASTTRNYGGTGLGLAISSSLVNLMGGRIRVESRPGLGSTFNFTVALTCRPESTDEPEATLRAREQLRGLPVLIVADNQTTRRILEAKPPALGHGGGGRRRRSHGLDQDS